MKKTNKLLSLLIVITMVLSTVVMPITVSAAGNLYPKGSFETFSTSDELQEIVWEYANPDRTYTLMTDGNGANGTSKYVKMSGSTWSRGNFQTPMITVEGGKKYTATMYLKSVSGSSFNADLRLYKTGDVQVASATCAVTGEWTKVELEYTTPSDITGLVVRVCGAATLPDLYVDEVSLEEVVQSTPDDTTPSDLCASWGTFDTAANLGATGVTGSGATATLVENAAIAHSGTKYIKISGRSYQDANISTPATAIEEGKSYKASFFVRLDEGTADTTVLPQVNYTGSGAVFRSEAVDVTDDAWTECTVEFTGTADFAGRWGQSVAMRAHQAGNVNLLYDDFSIVEITKPALTVTKDLDDNASGVTSSTKITVDFSNPVYNFSGKNDPSNSGVTTDQKFTDLSSANFELKNGSTVVGTVNVTRKSATSFELTLSGYDSNAVHTLSVKNVYDYFGNKITSQELVSFNTGISELMPYSSFEGDITLADLALNATSYYSAEITDADAKTGTKSLLISNRTNISDGYYQSKSLMLEQGQAYRMSAWVKLKNSEDAPRNAYMDAQTTGLGAKFRGEGITVTADEWTQVVVEFALDENTKGRWGYDITARAYVEGSAGDMPDYYIDDVSLTKINTPVLSASSIDAGSDDVAVNGTIEIDFTNPVYNFSGKTTDAAGDDQVFSNLNSTNFTLTGGSGSITVNRKSGTKYEVELSGLNPVTNYTITMSGGVDYFGQAISDSISFTTSPYIFVQLGNMLDGANDNNGYPFNSSFELPDTFQSYNFDGVRDTDFAGAIVAAADEGIEAVDGDNVFKMTNRNESANPSTKLKFYQIPGMQIGYRYQLTYYIRTVNPGDAITARTYFSPTALSSNAVTVDTISQPTVSVNSEGWTEVSGIVTLKELNPGGSNLGIHVGMETYGNADVYIDGFRFEQMIPLPELSSDMVNKASNVPTDAELILTCSNPFSYAGVLASDITLEKEDGTDVSSAVSIEKIDNSNYKVKLTGLDTATKYILTASGIKDVYRQDTEDLVINFSTTMAENVLSTFDTNFSFETGDTKGTISNAVGEIVEASAVGVSAPHGSKILKITDRTGTQGTQKFEAVGNGAAQPLEAGKEYELSFYIRTLPNAQGNGTTDTAKIFAETYGTGNSIKVDTVVADEFSISNNEWTKVTGRVKIAENGVGTNQGINIGFTTGGTNSVYIDKYELKEYYPEFTVTSDPANNATAITTRTINFKFSNPLKTALTAANFTITPAATVESITPVSETEYDVTFDFAYNTEYTIEFEDLEDNKFQFISEVITFTTSTGGGASDNNILAQLGFDWQADGGADGTAVPAVEYLAFDDTTKQIYWDTSVYNNGLKPLISTDEAYSGTGSIFINDTSADEYTWKFVQRRSRVSYFPMEDGKTYVVSAMLKLHDDAAVDSAQITFDLAGGENASNLKLMATSPKVEINGQTWTKVTATVDCSWINPTVTSDRPRAESHVQIHNTTESLAFYIDDVIIYEVPTDAFVMESSSPAESETEVSVSVGTISLNYSHSLDENQDLNADGLVTIWKGDTDVTATVLGGSITAGFGNKSIEIPVNVLDHNTNYTVKVSGLLNYAGQKAEDHEITFKTSNSVGYDNFVVLDSLGNELNLATAAAAEIDKISVDVSNLAVGAINMPMIIYTIYDSSNILKAVRTTTFSGQLADTDTRELPVPVEDKALLTSGSHLTIYVVNSYDNMTLVAPPMERTF